MYVLRYHKRAAADIPKLKAAKLDKKVQALLELMRHDPFGYPPPYEKLLGDLQGAYSRRINHQHRLVYTVDEEKKTVFVLSMWTHYEY